MPFSSIPQRFLLALAFIPGLRFVEVDRLSAWLSWIINLLVAWFLIHRLTKRENQAVEKLRMGEKNNQLV